jgi:hypothetical protein
VAARTFSAMTTRQAATMPRNSVVHADPIPSRAVPPPDPWMTSPITQRRRPPSAADPGRWAPGSVAPTSGWPVARYLLARRPHGEGGPRNVARISYVRADASGHSPVGSLGRTDR